MVWCYNRPPVPAHLKYIDLFLQITYNANEHLTIVKLTEKPPDIPETIKPMVVNLNVWIAKSKGSYGDRLALDLKQLICFGKALDTSIIGVIHCCVMSVKVLSRTTEVRKEKVALVNTKPAVRVKCLLTLGKREGLFLDVICRALLHLGKG